MIDAATGEILFHKAAREKAAAEHDISSLLEGLDQKKQEAEQTFEREFAAFQDRERLMEEKFNEAVRQAENEPDDGPPVRPFDLD